MILNLYRLSSLTYVASIAVDDAKGTVSFVQGDEDVKKVVLSQYEEGFDRDATVWDSEGNPGTIGVMCKPSESSFLAHVNRHLSFDDLCTESRVAELLSTPR